METDYHHRLVFIAVVVLLLTLASCINRLYAQDVPFPQRVAERCKGEASWAVPECACTVRNRLDAGFTEQNVLTPYYAQDAAPSPFDLYATTYILTYGCRPDLYFMFSNHDVAVLGLDYVLPLLVVREPGSSAARSVRFYAKDVFEKGD